MTPTPQRHAAPRLGRRAGLGAIALSLAALAAWGLLGAFSPLAGPVGSAFAQNATQQKDLANPAAGGATGTQPAAAGKEARSGSAEKEPVDREFIRALQVREQAVEARERELDRREEVLKNLQRDIDEKLQRLEKARGDLRDMTQQVDENREREIRDAVKRFKAMDLTSAAKILIQMDLAEALTILKRLDGQTVGGIFDAMVEVAEKEDPGVAGSAQDKKEKLARLKDLWVHMVNPDLPLKGAAPASSDSAAAR